MEAILFRKCLGLNDARAFGTQTLVTNPKDKEAGNTDLIECRNLTTTSDGCLEKLPPLVTALATGATITDLSADTRLMFSDGTNVKEWTTGSTIVNRFPATTGPIAHTLLDVRVATATKVYKSINPATAMAEAVVGAYTGPAVSTPFSAMPAFDHAFVYNAKLYSVNHADPRFVQYSEDYAYDLYALGDNHIGSRYTVLQAGAVAGTLTTTHNEGVSVYSGTGPHDFTKKFYPCAVIDNTLFSGFISKVYGNAHIWLCDDGVYTAVDGGIVSLTVDKIDKVGALNNTWYCSTVQNGKYLAFGDLCGVEYDFRTKTFLKRDTFGVTKACVWGGETYFAVGQNICKSGADIDTTENFTCGLTLPYSDLSAPGFKIIDSLYFTGTMSGEMLITVTDQEGKSWVREVIAGLVGVSNYRIKTPHEKLGNHLSVKVECTSGAFRLEELRAVFAASKRTR